MPGQGTNPLLFQLLNEMDGLGEDADVIFVLTTNRVELLEPALAMRPGRIDQAVEIGVPDDDCRARLFELYLRDLPALDADIDLAPLVAATDGVSAAFIKELTRRAVLLAAVESGDSTTAPTVGARHLSQALAALEGATARSAAPSSVPSQPLTRTSRSTGDLERRKVARGAPIALMEDGTHGATGS